MITGNKIMKRNINNYCRKKMITYNRDCNKKNKSSCNKNN